MVHVFVGGFIIPQYKFSYKTDMSINIIFTGKSCNEDYSLLLSYSPETRYVLNELLKFCGFFLCKTKIQKLIDHSIIFA